MKRRRANDAFCKWQGLNPNYYMGFVALAHTFNKLEGYDFRVETNDEGWITDHTCDLPYIVSEIMKYDDVFYVHVFRADEPEDGNMFGWFNFYPANGEDAIVDWSTSLSPLLEDAA